MYTRKTSLEYEETNPIRFENHKSELVMLLNQVSTSTSKYVLLQNHSYLKVYPLSSYKDHLYKDQALNLPEFKDHQYWIWEN